MCIYIYTHTYTYIGYFWTSQPEQVLMFSVVKCIKEKHSRKPKYL